MEVFDKMTNAYECSIILEGVPGDDEEEVLLELADIISNVEILPYDYDVKLTKIGRIL